MQSRGHGEAPIRPLLERYVMELKAAGAIRSPSVEAAFLAVKRHRLVETFYRWTAQWQDASPIPYDPEHPDPEQLELIYSNTALGTRFVDGMPASSTSQPALVAEMLELLELEGGMKVLEIGAGTGYNAALMAEIVGDQRLVVTVDILEDVVTQTRRLLAGTGYPEIRVLLRDGFEGVPEESLFDRIVATVGCSDLSPRWGEQLADAGCMLVPLEHAGGHPLVRLGKDEGRLQGRIVGWSGFMAVRGPLHVDGMWAEGTVRPGSDEEVHEREPWAGFGEGEEFPALGCSADEIDFVFFTGLEDRRACWGPHGVGLSDALKGWAQASPVGIRWWGDDSLAAELDRLHEGWLVRGRPRIRDYRVRFVPIDDDETAAAGCWTIDRRFFREFVWL